ncbi:MAG TPA: hypothetical protein VES65_01840 [Solirubrobacteraceae bacterium]|nr:hypothetical protein [Solirubrobacteraceae bacterium]
MSAIASASASALEFYKCVKVAAGTGTFNDSHCNEAGGSKEYAHELLAELLEILSKGTEKFTLGGELLKVKVEISCENEHGTGSIHNGKVKVDLPEGSPEEVLTGLGLVTNEFTLCKVETPAGCQVKEPIIAESLIQLSTVGAIPYVLFSPDDAVNSTNKTFVKITLEGCIIAGTYSVTGMAAGKAENETSSVGFTKGAPNNKLKFGGNEATFTGKSQVTAKSNGDLVKIL